MYLKKITISGFKSFATRTVIDFDAGISAIVGPNGSGKSNVVEAIRWALGEQSAKQLRSSDREELIFAGSEGRARASMAEVILTFDNTDGALPLELGEVELARRLYRSGEAEYRLAGRVVRLADIQAMLAEGGVGAESYAVVGQGMIDQLLLSSPAERKLLFEEASGIRSLELKRASAQRKLEATATNLVRLQDIANEIEPRLSGLKQAAAKASETEKLEVALRDARLKLLAAAKSTASEINQLAKRETTLRQEVVQTEQAVASLETERDEYQNGSIQAADRREQALEELAAAESARQQAVQTATSRRIELAELEVRLQAVKPRAASTKLATSVQKAEARLGELRQELAQAQSNDRQTQRRLDAVGKKVLAAQAVLGELRAATRDGQQQQYVLHALDVMKMVARHLDQPDVQVENLRLLIHKAGRLLSHASKGGQTELLHEIHAAQDILEKLMNERETQTEHHTNLVIAVRSLEIDVAHQEVMVDRLRLELETVERQAEEHTELASRRQELTIEAKAADKAVALAQTAVDHLHQTSNEEPASTERLFELAAELETARERRRTTQQELENVIRSKSDLEAAVQRVNLTSADWHLTASKAGEGELETLERDVTLLEERLAIHRETLGGQASEYQEVSTRYTELTHQIADLTKAQTDLGEVVKSLEAATRERFEAGFAAINDHFDKYFQRLFEGGRAQLTLQHGEDGDYGIEIRATPAGKRLASLASLSGGERSMAGVALVAAILATSPSPFVVMDEVDAALDEANSGRLAIILKELGKHSQLILVTHNRQTMAAARNLYGVTMDRAQVSKVLSLRLEEARELAAR